MYVNDWRKQQLKGKKHIFFLLGTFQNSLTYYDFSWFFAEKKQTKKGQGYLPSVRQLVLILSIKPFLNSFKKKKKKIFFLDENSGKSGNLLL